MRKITLICSVHNEKGICNAEELLKILRAINPEVVFPEMHPSKFDYLYRRGSVEVHAITKYRSYKLFQLVPVDLREFSEMNLIEFKKDIDRTLDYVGQTTLEYRQIDEEIDNNTKHLGFHYLNSAAFTTMMAKMFEIEDEVIGKTGDKESIRLLKLWRESNQKREVEMVSNIYKYSRENDFDAGVFFVGAAHKMGIVKEVEKYSTAEADLIKWNFFYGQS